MHLAIEFKGRRAGACAQAVHRAQADGAVGAGAMVVQCQLFTQLCGQCLAATALARFGAAQAQGMACRRRGTEIVVEADHPAHLGQAEVEGMGYVGDGGIRDETDAFLHGMQDRQECTRGVLVAAQDIVDNGQVKQLIRHTADLGITAPARLL